MPRRPAWTPPRFSLLFTAMAIAGCGGGDGGSNRPPVANDDAAMTVEATAVAVDVLANDVDPEGGDFTIAEFTDGTNGVTFLSAAGVLTYLPDAGFSGTDTFTYEISDDGNGTASATVTITIGEIADFEEAAEPNDDGEAGDSIAGSFALPALGADAVVLQGCIDPYRDVDGDGDDDIDFDAWEITTTEASVAEVTVDGSGGLAGGFFFAAADPFLANAGWIRFGIDAAGDTSSRQVYLPTPGTYILVVTDMRSLTFGSAAGSPDACYFAAVERVAPASPITGTIGTPFTVPAGDVPTFVDFTPSANGQSLSIGHTIDGNGSIVQSSVLALRDGVPDAYDADGIFGVAALDTSNVLRLVVEPRYDATLSPREVTLDVTIVP